MSDIIQFDRPAPPTAPPKPETLRTHFADAYLLEMTAVWRASRAQMQKNWACHEIATGYGWLDDRIKLDREPLETMLTMESRLAECEPRTMLAAREMLRMCVTILAMQVEDPQHTMAQGPILEIIRNVLTSLDAVKSDLPVGNAALPPRRRRKRKA
jgi:hypothetical protein